MSAIRPRVGTRNTGELDARSLRQSGTWQTFHTIGTFLPPYNLLSEALAVFLGPLSKETA